MNLFKFFLGVLLVAFSTRLSVSSSSSDSDYHPESVLGTGFQNNHSICHVNALVSCLYDVTPFRKAIYDNFNQNDFIKIISGVFVVKQLNIIPEFDLQPNLVPLINSAAYHQDFGDYDEIDGLFKLFFKTLPRSITNTIGYEATESKFTIDGSYLVKEGLRVRTPMISVILPDIQNSESLNFQDLVDSALIDNEIRNYDLYRNAHPVYFSNNQISPSIFKVSTQVVVQKSISQYKDVVPVFINRRAIYSRKFRLDPLHNMNMLTFTLENGNTVQYELNAFAVDDGVHYYSCTKSFPTEKWLVFNDDRVREADMDHLMKNLQTRAVMLFYVKEGSSVETVIPEVIKNWVTSDLIPKQLENDLFRRNVREWRKLERSNAKRQRRMEKKRTRKLSLSSSDEDDQD